MNKRTKLTEKATRIPDTRPAHWEEIFTRYLREIEPVKGEPARSLRFGMLTQELFGFQPGFIESYISGIEKYLKVKQKDRIVRGKADNLFGNVLIEFEARIPKHREEAEEQLRRYVAILWSQESPDIRTPYLCIATDGVRFVTYSPTLADQAAKEVQPENVCLQVLEEADWTKLEPEAVFYWLDRYFLRKEILAPTGETMVRDFGPRSHAFQTTAHAMLGLWQEVKTQSAFAVIYDSWEKYLRIVYGSDVAADALFVRHTYLATLAKVMAWMRITESTRLPDDAHIVEMLEGRLFKRYGVENFIEEDFFSWLARAEAVKVGVGIVRWLFSLLQNYNLRGLSEDVLKSLYQELVDPETRHDLGEFYTPDWLAHRMVRKLLDANPRGAMLDPACGSGSFLYLAIREKRERLGDSVETVQHILDSVYGADIHPLAVIVAKTNYILALGDLMKKRRGVASIPVYLADAIQMPELVKQQKIEIKNGALVEQLPGYRVELDGKEVYLPEMLVQNLGLFDQAIELAKEYARQNKGRPMDLEPFRNFLAAQRFPASDNDAFVQALYAIAETLKYFIDSDRDTIWAFVLKNIYKPLFFKRKFDFIMGNPPWIAFRFMEPAYQKFLKRQITMEYKLLTGRGENIANLEVATLFLVRAADLYLKMGGTIAFVLPKSLFSADQHDGLRKRRFKFSEGIGQMLFWREIWDCEFVTPLFNVPASVLIADKADILVNGHKGARMIPGQILSGNLGQKNASLVEAESALTVEDVEFSVHTLGKRSFWATGKAVSTGEPSYYKKPFRRGADIMPRSFWFVQMKPSPLGFNPDLPLLETAERAKKQAKDAYKGVVFKDTVESRFLYATLLSTDLLPFGHFDYRLVVLPIEPEGNHYKLIDANEARQRGFLHLVRWLERVQKEWKKRRSSKAGRLSALEWLNYRQKLTVQNIETEYWVIYNVSGTFVTACVKEKKQIEFAIGDQKVHVSGFVADYVTNYFPTKNRAEADYLTAILNAPIVDKSIKPMQARGLWGPRHICKKVLELPIPQFDEKNAAHRRLTELGEVCSANVEHWLASGGPGKIKSIGKLRSMVREMLRDELKEIDERVKEILM